MFNEKLQEQFFNAYKFLTATTITSSYSCKKVFTLMNIWMIGKK